jgi:hypothetical protein
VTITRCKCTDYFPNVDRVIKTGRETYRTFATTPPWFGCFNCTQK